MEEPERAAICRLSWSYSISPVQLFKKVTSNNRGCVLFSSEQHMHGAGHFPF